jgi:hypothetical protein
MKKVKLTSVEDHLKEKMKDPKFKREWDKKAGWRAGVRKEIESNIRFLKYKG